jgi:large subunit ribosomal protein L7/L12
MAEEQVKETTQAKQTRKWSKGIKELGDKIVGLTLMQAKELGDYLKDEHGIEPARKRKKRPAST